MDRPRDFDFIDLGKPGWLGQVEDGLLTRLDLMEENQGLGDIIRGRISRVLPGMEAAFVDIGYEAQAFLPEKFALPLKGHMPKAGDTVLVEVKKAPHGTKGATVSMDISLKGEALVLLPYSQGVKVSKKISQEEGSQRLRDWARSKNLDSGLIIRTRARDMDLKDLDGELDLLIKEAQNIVRQVNFLPTPKLIYSQDSLEAFILDRRGDLPLLINDREAYQALRARQAQDLVLEEGFSLMETPSLRRQVETLLHRRVDLDNGANLVIDETEALTVIDVNTGSKVKGRDFSSLADETNDLAAREAIRQIRLRNLSGMVVIDFLESKRDPQVLTDLVKETLEDDPVKTQVYGYTRMGLFEFSRERRKEPLAERLRGK